MAGNPVSMGTGRLGVGSRNPDITGTVPAMVAGLPFPAGMRWGRDHFVYRSRRTDVDVDLRESRGTRRQSDSEGEG